MKLFIDESAWISLLNRQSPTHALFTSYFAETLHADDKLFTNNIAIAQTVNILRQQDDMQSMIKFTDTVEAATAGAHLTVLWVGRRTQKDALRLMRKHTELKLDLFDFAACILMNRRRVRSIFTTKTDFRELGIKVFPQAGA